jgi:toxin ParE1/3/4
MKCICCPIHIWWAGKDYGLLGLHERFEMLAEQPTHGRKADELAPGLRRLGYQSPVVFYMPTDNGIRIVGVLHQRMDVTRHL